MDGSIVKLFSDRAANISSVRVAPTMFNSPALTVMVQSILLVVPLNWPHLFSFTPLTVTVAGAFFSSPGVSGVGSKMAVLVTVVSSQLSSTGV